MNPLNEWIDVLEDDQSGDGELLCLLLELRRHRENNWQQRAEAAEAKLAELEKQPPYGTLINTFLATDSRAIAEARKKGMSTVEVFTRPAPAINLADLVPDPMNYQAACLHCQRDDRPDINHGFLQGVNWMRAAMIRNIEEAK